MLDKELFEQGPPEDFDNTIISNRISCPRSRMAAAFPPRSLSRVRSFARHALSVTGVGLWSSPSSTSARMASHSSSRATSPGVRFAGLASTLAAPSPASPPLGGTLP